MDDKSVLDFQVEYHSLMNKEEEQRVYLNQIKAQISRHRPINKIKIYERYRKRSTFRYIGF